MSLPFQQLCREYYVMKSLLIYMFVDRFAYCAASSKIPPSALRAIHHLSDHQCNDASINTSIEHGWTSDKIDWCACVCNLHMSQPTQSMRMIHRRYVYQYVTVCTPHTRGNDHTIWSIISNFFCPRLWNKHLN